MSSPHFQEIMSQQRRIFDGTSGASYKNRTEDMRYTGLRTPWIIAGTPALLASDQSRLGDRFLKVFFDNASLNEQQDILRRVGFTALRAVVQTSDGNADSHVEENLNRAYKMTGGYVNWLRSNIADEISKLMLDEDMLVDQCAAMAEFTASLRARPDPDAKKDVPPTKEEPYRLQHQFVRLAVCLAVVLNRREADEEVIRRTKKVAIDTSRGHSFDICTKLYLNPNGLTLGAVSAATGRTDEKTRTMLRFLKQIKVVNSFAPKQEKVTGRVTASHRWKLTSRMFELYKAVME
jgi:hypothetical protein